MKNKIETFWVQIGTRIPSNIIYVRYYYQRDGDPNSRVYNSIIIVGDVDIDRRPVLCQHTLLILFRQNLQSGHPEPRKHHWQT